MLPIPDDISCHCGNVLQNADLRSRDAMDADGHVTNLQPHRLMEEPLHPLYCRRTCRAGLRQIRHDKMAKIVQRQFVGLYHNATATSEPMINQNAEKTWRHPHYRGRQTNHLGCDGHLSRCTFHGQQAQLSSHPRCCGRSRGQEKRKVLT